MDKESKSHIKMNLTPITDRFSADLGDLLGAGNYGRVYLGYDNSQDCVIAVKHVERQHYMQNKYLNDREIKVMTKLKHPNIIQFH